MGIRTTLTRWLRPSKRRKTEVGPIFCDRGAKNARKVFQQRGYPLVHRPEEAELLWLRSLSRGLHTRMRADQLLNHIPREYRIIDKGNLTQVLGSHDATRSTDGLRMADFHQESYRLYEEDERRRFLALLPQRDDPENLWILKPTDLSKGRGIRIFWQFDELKKKLLHPARHGLGPGDLRYVAQRYIKNPLLLDGRKSEIRIYWMIASVEPLLVLMYREGTVRLNTLPFQLDDFDNQLIHVTNVYQQKKHVDYDPDAVLKWSFAELEDYVEHTLHLTGPDFLEEHLRPRLKSYLRFLVEGARQDLLRRPPRGHFFGLYGADLILDDTLNPWLTEIQEGPGLNFDDYIKRRVIPPLVQEAVQIAFEVRRRKQTGASLETLDSVAGFEWVINEAPG